MDQFNYENTENYSETNTGQFNDLPGFGNNFYPTVNENPNQLASEPIPALPEAHTNFRSFMNHSNSTSDLFGTYINESHMINDSLKHASEEKIVDTSEVFDKSKTIFPSNSGIKFYSRNDVLCGRGGGTNVHPGNRRFRVLIDANRRTYLKARKNDKPAISRSIVRTIREMNGRFLKKDEKLDLWFEIGDDAAREKTSQALRQRAPEMKKLLLQDEQRQRNEQLARKQQATLMQRGFINNPSMNNGFTNNFSKTNGFANYNSNFSKMNNQIIGSFNPSDLQGSSNAGTIYEQYAMLQQQKFFAREKDSFLKKLAMNGFDTSSFQNQRENIDNLTSQTLLSQGIKLITPRGA